MLKNELLSHCYSKAQWHAILQSKKVCFPNLNPNLERNVDLRGALREFKFSSNYDEVEKPTSEILGEKYGRKYPLFTISDMKISQFWPFVASQMWSDCSSLRVAKGELLNCLMETYKDLDQNGYVFRYVTNIYEDVVMAKVQTCLTVPRHDKKSGSSKKDLRDANNISDAQPNSLNSGDKQAANGDAPTPEIYDEATVIRFVYFGTSLQHLREILVAEGRADVTLADIARQNGICSPLRALCAPDHTRVVPVTVERTHVGESWATNDGDGRGIGQLDSMGRRRPIVRRKFTAGDIYWSSLSGDAGKAPQVEEGAFFDATYRAARRKRKQLERVKDEIRRRFVAVLRKTYQQSTNPYERWWFHANQHDLQYELVEKPTKPKPKPESAPPPPPAAKAKGKNTPPPAKAAKSNTENKKKSPSPPEDESKSSHELPKPKVDSPRKRLTVDRWVCSCSVCNGVFLSVKNISRFPSSFAGNAMVVLRGENRTVKKVESTVKTRWRLPKVGIRTIKEFKSTKKVNQLNRSISVRQHSSVVMQKQSGVIPPAKARKNSKKQPELENIFWESVSNYTTPFWRTVYEEDDKNLRFEKQSKLEDEAIIREVETVFKTKKLNLTYSFDKLRKNKPVPSMPASAFGSPEAKGKSKLPTVPEKSEANKSNGVNSSSDLTALEKHGILFSHVPGKAKEYTKLKVNISMDQPEQITGQKVGEKIKSGSSKPGSVKPSKSSVSVDTKTAVELEPSPSIDEKFDWFLETEDFTPTCSSDGGKSTAEPVAGGNCPFDSPVPADFRPLCMAALNMFVVRVETVMTSRNYNQVTSFTVNRFPICAYPRSHEYTNKA